MDGAGFRLPVRNWSGEQIRFMTAGSVDDGKSTLIGRLLLDSQALMRDEAPVDSGDIDLSTITDGLEAERAQGITIDVAYRYFATPRNSFIIADAPGHEQYTRNMVTAASVSDVAVIVIDASRVKGGVLKPQTRRHASIAALMGLDMIVAVNKMDLVDWSQARFDEVCNAFEDVTRALGVEAVSFTPIAAKSGENVVNAGGPDWYDEATLLQRIEASRARLPIAGGQLRLPIQVVLREGVQRFYAGRIESGAIRPGDKVRVGASGASATVARVSIGGAGVTKAGAGASVAVELAEDRDLTRGDVIASGETTYARRMAADLCWLDEAAWTPGRRYRLRQGAQETQALIEQIEFVRDMSDLAATPAASLQLNDVASVRLTTRDPILADRYDDLPGTGAFVLFDPDTNQTAAAGMIRGTLS